MKIGRNCPAADCSITFLTDLVWYFPFIWLGKHEQQNPPFFHSKNIRGTSQLLLAGPTIRGLCGTAASWNPHRLEGLVMPDGEDKTTMLKWSQWAMASRRLVGAIQETYAAKQWWTIAKFITYFYIIVPFGDIRMRKQHICNNKYWLANHPNFIRFAASRTFAHRLLAEMNLGP